MKNELKYLSAKSFCKKNGYHTSTGRISFSRKSMEYFSLNYCNTDWETVDKDRLKYKMIQLFGCFDQFNKDGFPIFEYKAKHESVDLY